MGMGSLLGRRCEGCQRIIHETIHGMDLCDFCWQEQIQYDREAAKEESDAREERERFDEMHPPKPR